MKLRSADHADLTTTLFVVRIIACLTECVWPKLGWEHCVLCFIFQEQVAIRRPLRYLCSWGVWLLFCTVHCHANPPGSKPYCTANAVIQNFNDGDGHNFSSSLPEGSIGPRTSTNRIWESYHFKQTCKFKDNHKDPQRRRRSKWMIHSWRKENFLI